MSKYVRLLVLEYLVTALRTKNKQKKNEEEAVQLNDCPRRVCFIFSF